MSKQEEKFNKRRLKSSFITTVISITLVLFMLGLLGLIILNARKISDNFKEDIRVYLYFYDDAKETDIFQLQKSIDASAIAKSTEYTSKEKAEKKFVEETGEDFVQLLGVNPLPTSIDVQVKSTYLNEDSLSVLEKQFKKNPIVKEVRYDKLLVQKVNYNIKRISLFLLSFSLILLIIAIALIHNTIKLSVYSKRFLIKTMQLVGATERFIRRPFVLKGLLGGVYGALLAIVLLSVTIYLAQGQFPDLVNTQDIDIFLILFGIVIILGLFLSWISTFFAVKKYLNMKNDKLYY